MRSNLLTFEATIREKYETLVKEKTLLRIERDRLQEKLKTVSDTNKSLEDDGEKTRITKKTSGLVWSAWPKWSGKSTALSASKRQEVLSISEEASVHAHQGPVSCVNGQSSVDHLVSGGDDGIVKIFDCSDISNVTLLGALEGGHSSFVSSVRYYSSRVISSGGDGCVILWDVSSGSILTKIKQHASCVWSVDVRDPYLVTGSMDHSAKLIDLNVGRARRAFRAHVDSVNSVKLFKENSMITGSADKSVSIWDVRTAHCEHTLYWHKTAAVNCVAGGSALIASGDMHGNVCITDIRNVSIPLCVYGGHGVCVNSLDWTDDGGDDVVAIASRDGSIKLFSVLKNAIVYSTVDGNGQTDVLCVTSTCGKSRLLSSDSAGFLKIWTTSSSSYSYS